MRHLIQTLLMVLGASLLPGHGSAAERTGDMGAMNIDPPSYIMDGVHFKAGRPAPRESLLTALADPEIGMAALQTAARYLADTKDLRIVVSGYADKSECASNDCDALAQRRAAFVYDWLKFHDVAPRQLVRHEGRGISEPVDFSDTEAQRQNNRRVELRPFQTDALDEGK